MIKANNLRPDELFLLFYPPLLSVIWSAESNVTGKDREVCSVNPTPHPWPAHSRLNPTGRVCRVVGVWEEEEAKSLESLRNEKAGREGRSELVKARGG